ncbi:hypothetical protein BGZ72_001548 [Mortierella alpina]|nr:hypothetical protein BGZ72_001548 [Mortierella alpina]
MGPSIFVIWKAALLKKRILIYTPPPVETACLAVYNICLMATIPFGTAISPQNKPNERLQPLFCVGIHDMDHMQAITGGYVACTTDKIFMFKPQLYDVLIDLSASTSKTSYSTSTLAHPKIQETRDIQGDIVLQDAGPHLIDNRRYFVLLQQLGRFRRQQEWLQRRLCAEAALSGASDVRMESSTQELNASALYTDGLTPEGGFNMSDTLRKMITGGWWWWYGDDDSDAEPEEYESLITRATQVQAMESDPQQGQDPRPSSTRLQDLQAQSSGTPDMEAIRFFHNLTRAILSDLARLISFRTTAAIFEDRGPPSQSLDGYETSWIEITKDDIQELGLDPGRDAQFIRALGRLYFDADIRQRNSTFSLWCQGVARLALSSCNTCCG